MLNIVIITTFVTITIYDCIMTISETYSTQQLTQMLYRHSIRPSVQRIAVLSHVAGGSHPSAEEIYAGLSEQFPSLSRTTVYNALHLFVEKHLLRELEIESGCVRYDIAMQEPHSHFVCRRCGRIMDMRMPDGIADIVLPGYTIEMSDVFLKGICPECHKTQQQPK